jgi:hypothetical protein
MGWGERGGLWGVQRPTNTEMLGIASPYPLPFHTCVRPGSFSPRDRLLLSSFTLIPWLRLRLGAAGRKGENV